MSTSDIGRESVERSLAHHGVKGMKWGVRNDSSSGSSGDVAIKTKPGKTRVKTAGGKGLPAHEDAVAAAVARQKARGSHTDALSNKELQSAVQRMNLERQYSQLTAERGAINKGKKFVKGLFGVGKTYNEALAFEKSPGGQQIREKLTKTA